MNSVDHSISPWSQARGPARWMMVMAWFSASASLCVPGIIPFIPGMGGTACAATPDFGKGFDLLFELGLQELPADRWEYREIEGVGSREILPSSGMDDIRAVVTELEKTYTRGWADKTTGEPGKPELLVWDGWQTHDSTQLVHSWSEPKRISLLPADERADAQALAKGLQAIATSKPVRDNLLYSPNTIISFFFRAAQYHRRGYKAEAEAAAQALFAIVPRQDRLLDLAVQTLAGQQYQKALDKFSGTRDWLTLNTDLKRLLQTYSRGWAVRPLIEKLQQSVQKRLSLPLVPALAQASSLTPEQQAWWASVTDGPPPKKQGATEPEPEEYPYGMNKLGEQWLIGVRMAANPEGFSELEKQKDSLPAWQRAVLTQGWDWISIIAAGLGDDVLVGHLVPSYDPFGHSFEFDNDAPILTEEEIDEHWKNFRRPQTRGDLARDFVENVLPYSNEKGETLPMDLAELRDLAIKVAKDIHGKSPVEVAKYYLEAGTNNQKSHALSGIIRNGNDADLEFVANLVLENPLQYFEHFTELVQRQKSVARPVLAHFRKALLEQLAPVLDQDPNLKPGELPNHYQYRLKSLEALAAGRTISSVIEDYINGKVPGPKLEQELRDVAVSAKEQNLLPDLGLEAAARLPKGDGTRKSELICSTFDFGKDLTDVRRLALLRIIQEDGEAPALHENIELRTLSQQLYWHAGVFGNTDRGKFREEVVELDPAALLPIWIERGKATLENRPLPELPSAEEVPAQRRLEIRQAIAKRLEHGWPEYLHTLSLAEKLALQKELRQEVIPQEWRTLALRITKVAGSNAALTQLAPIDAALGKQLDGKLLSSLAEACRIYLLQEGTDIGLTITLSRLPLLQGWEIKVENYTPKDLDDPDQPLLRAVEWIQKFKDQFGAPSGTQGCASLWMPLDHFEIVLSHWHLDAANKWQAWATADYPGPGTASAPGEVVSEVDIIAAIDERFRTWSPSQPRFWVQASAFRLRHTVQGTTDAEPEEHP